MSKLFIILISLLIVCNCNEEKQAESQYYSKFYILQYYMKIYLLSIKLINFT